MTMFADANATLDRTRLQTREDQKVTINTRSIGRWAAAAATIALVAACSVAPGTDKSGSDTVVLRLATIDLSTTTASRTGRRPSSRTWRRCPAAGSKSR